MGLLGPNGAGKSTLIRMFAGVLRPDSGSVEVAGQPPTDFRIRAKIGWLPEHNPLPLHRSVGHVERGLRLGHVADPEGCQQDHWQPDAHVDQAGDDILLAIACCC